MTYEEAAITTEAMTILDYFPSAPAARALVTDELARMVETFEQGTWLIRRMSNLYGKWPGLHEMRAAYCGRYSPLDGIEVYSQVYIDGISSERPQPERAQIAEPRQAIEPVDPEAQRLLEELAKEITIRVRAEKPLGKILERVEVTNPVTAEDVEREMAKRHEKAQA